MSMIISRKHIILAALVLALGTAIFLNWKFTNANGGFSVKSVFNTSSSLGDTSLVDNQKVSTADDSYFAQVRLDREQNVAKSEETIKNTVSGASFTTADKANAEKAIEAIAANMNTETVIEGLVKAKGFGDCVAYINNNTVNVVVKIKSGNELTSAQAAQIKDIVLDQTKVSAGNIRIIPTK